MRLSKQVLLTIMLALALLAGPALADEAKPKTAVKAAATPAPAVKPSAPMAAAAKKAKAKPAAKADAAKPAAKDANKKVAPDTADPEDPLAMFMGIVKAAKGGQWALLIGFILMLLTWILNKLLKSKIPPKVLPWVSIGLGVLTQMAMTVAAGSVASVDTWIAAITGGISLGLAGAGSYSAIGKYLPGIKNKPAAAVEDAKPTESSS